MKNVTIDCRGMSCPQPVIKTKESLEDGCDQLSVIVDNEASRTNVMRFARSRGCEVSVSNLDGGCFEIALTVVDAVPGNADFDVDEFTCEIPAGNGLVYVISSASMGRGSDELGWALLQTYIQTMKDVHPLPTKILFYNEGVRLVAEESGALSALKELQDKGVEIMACGTCLDYYKLTSAMQVGHISNMYDIMSAVNNASRVVSPL